MVFFMKKYSQRIILIFGFLFTTTQNIFFAINFRNTNASINIKDSATLLIKSSLTANNGIISKTSKSNLSTTTTFGSINFNSSQFNYNGLSKETSTYNLAGVNSTTLSGYQNIIAETGSIIESLTVSGTGNSISGSPTFSSNVTLQDSNSYLLCGIKSKMNKNFILNGGTLKLSDDLSFADNSTISGTGTINLGNAYRLSFGAKPLTFSSSLIWQNATDITLNGKTALNATWTFSGDSVINGNGNILDLTSGGALAIGGDTALSITDIYLKGIGPSSITFTNTNSTIRLANTTLEMNGNLTINTGKMYIDGATTIITKANTLAFSGSGLLTVDGQTLWYDRLGLTTNTTITPTTVGSNLSLLNNGIILSAGGDLTSLNATITTLSNQMSTIDHGPGDVTISGNTTLSYDYNLSDIHRFLFTANATVDGAGHRLNMSNKNSTAQFVVSNGVSVTLTNCLIDNFSGAHLSLGTGSSLIFGSGTRVMSMTNDTLNTTLRFGGGSIFDGCGTNLTFGSSGQILSVDSSGVIIKDFILSNLKLNYISASSSTCPITFDNIAMILGGNYAFTTGFFNIKNTVKILGNYIFSYQSTSTSQINSNSDLVFEKGSTFQYLPASSSGLLLSFTDSSARLCFDNTTLSSTLTGIQLIVGTLKVDGQMSISNTATLVCQAPKFGNNAYLQDLTIDLYPGASIITKSGSMLSYQNQELPPPLRWGDQVILQHKNFGYFLGIAPNRIRQTYSGAPTVYNQDTGTVNTIIVAGFLNTNGQTQWRLDPFQPSTPYSINTSDIGQIYPAGGGSLATRYPALTNYYELTQTTGYGVYENSLYLLSTSNAAPVSTPRPPYFGVGLAGSGVYPRTVLASPTGAASFRLGDTCQVKYASSSYYLYGTNNQYTSNSVTYYEVCGYNGTASDDNDKWIIYQIISNINGVYASVP